jgi:hypothetical protein
MIIHKLWKAKRGYDTWLREGWFLFGLIPLYVRDVQNREKF